jgi:hypothetical protein
MIDGLNASLAAHSSQKWTGTEFLNPYRQSLEDEGKAGHLVAGHVEVGELLPQRRDEV